MKRWKHLGGGCDLLIKLKIIQNQEVVTIVRFLCPYLSTDRRISYSGRRSFRAPEKLQIVKPIKGKISTM